ncbi:anti-repressor SinI family protein [Fictibacillus barbaricus]|nr:anti-repressor SinI family protein [Fictibacillus barbaricus]
MFIVRYAECFDQEWMKLIIQAKEQGITLEEIQAFLKTGEVQS